MKAINFINWKYIGLAGCLVMSLLAACSDDETASEVVTPLEPKLEIVNESSTFSFSSAGNSAQVLTFNANQNWYIVLDDSEGVDNSWVVFLNAREQPEKVTKCGWLPQKMWSRMRAVLIFL